MAAVKKAPLYDPGAPENRWPKWAKNLAGEAKIVANEEEEAAYAKTGTPKTADKVEAKVETKAEAPKVPEAKPTAKPAKADKPSETE